MIGRRAIIALAVVGLTVAACGSQNSAESGGEWSPTGTVELMVPGSAGGGSDLITREFEKTLAGRDVTAEVRNYSTVESYLQLSAMPGEADRLLTANYGGAVLTPILQDLDYSWESFTPVALVGEDFTYVVTGKDSGLATFDDVVAKAKAGRVTVGQVQSSGQNTQLTRQLEDALGTTLEPVVFEGGGQQLTATLAGDVDISLMEPSEFIDQLEAGALRALVTLGPKSFDDRLSSVPSAEEAGLNASFVSQWRGFFAAKDITEAQRRWWENAVKQWTESQEFGEYLKNSLMTPNFLTGTQFEDYLKESVTRAESVQQ